MNAYLESFLVKAKDVADVAGKKTEEMIELSKYKLESVRLNGEIKKAYERLGSSVYAMVKGGYENQELMEGLTEDIDELMMRLDAVTEKIADMRRVVCCPVCGAKNSSGTVFCGKCATKLTPDDAEADEVAF